MATLASPFKGVMGWLSGKALSLPRAGSVIASLYPHKMSTPIERGVSGMLVAFNRSPWVRAVVAKISSTFGSTEWRVFATRRIGTDRGWVKMAKLQRQGIDCALFDAGIKQPGLPEGIELVEIYDHLATTFLNSASRGFPSIVSRQLTQVYRELSGEAFWLLDFEDVGNKLIPTGFWLIPPTWIDEVPSPESPYFVVNVKDSRSPPFKIPMEMIIWFCNPDPVSPYKRGSGHMRALGDEIDTDEYAAKHVRAWFYNSARPDLLIYGRDLSRTDTDQLEAKWMHKLRGYLSAHRPFFLKAAVEVKDLSHKFADMQMIELRKFERDMLVHARGVPPEVLGIIENSNRATIDAADYLFAKHVVVPELDVFRSHLQMHLMPFYDDRLIIGYDSPVGEDKEYKLEVARSARWAFTLNELRRMGGEDPVPYGNVHVFQLQDLVVTPDQLEGGYSPMGAVSGNGNPSGSSAPEEEPGEEEAAFPPRALARGAEAPALPEGQRERARRWQEKQVGGLETTNLATKLSDQMISDLVEAFSQLQGELNMTGLIAALERGDIDAALTIIDQLDISEALESARQTLRQALLTITGVAAEQLAAALGIEAAEIDLVSQAALEELAQFGAGMVKDVSDNTVDAIRAALIDAYATGRSATEVANEIRSIIGLTEYDAKKAIEKFEKLLAEGYSISQANEALEAWIESKIKKRAETIAINELIHAGTRGQEMIWEEAVKIGLLNPALVEREWLISLGACEICVPNKGLRAKIGQPFTTNKGSVYTPNDIHVKCRCGERLVFLTSGG
jgi:hypothetical protein